mmetsp:Transcript_1320/g.4190  ORF Transcript_1320/g.4190 Transcript_1320/m.4190 type:complete len:225 (+) Transcript_1320:267-941(+)
MSAPLPLCWLHRVDRNDSYNPPAARRGDRGRRRGLLRHTLGTRASSCLCAGTPVLRRVALGPSPSFEEDGPVLVVNHGHCCRGLALRLLPLVAGTAFVVGYRRRRGRRRRGHAPRKLKAGREVLLVEEAMAERDLALELLAGVVHHEDNARPQLDRQLVERRVQPSVELRLLVVVERVVVALAQLERVDRVVDLVDEVDRRLVEGQVLLHHLLQEHTHREARGV